MDETRARLLDEALDGPADLVLSDMAANTVGHTQTDHLRTMGLVEAAAEFAVDVLRARRRLCRQGASRAAPTTSLLALLKRHFATRQARQAAGEPQGFVRMVCDRAGVQGAGRKGIAPFQRVGATAIITLAVMWLPLQMLQSCNGFVTVYVTVLELLIMRQIAALPYTMDESGSMRILLITSRETRRWVIPKGNRIKGLAAHRAAEHEAFEEAGIAGIACPAPLGSYRYRKHRRDGTARTATVDVFPLAVTGQSADWPEREERDQRWFSVPDAANAVDEPDLKSMIAAFREPPEEPGAFTRAILWLRLQGGERIPMLRWFQALMPKQGRFFEQFEDHAATLVAGADALARLLQGGPDMADHCREIFDREHEADDIIREVLQDVRRTFVTPFDRSAITGLIGSMDDAIDQMNQTAKATSFTKSPNSSRRCGT